MGTEFLADMTDDELVEVVSMIVEDCLKSSITDKEALSHITTILKHRDVSLLSIRLEKFKEIDPVEFRHTKKLIGIKINTDIYHKKATAMIAKLNRIPFFSTDIDSTELKSSLEDISQKTQAFNDKKFHNSLRMSYMIKKGNSMAAKQWDTVNAAEMEDRLIMLRKLYGQRFIKESGGSSIHCSEYKNMSFNEKKDYYMSNINSVVETVQEGKNTVLMYLGLKQVYNEILGTINITSDVSFSDSEESIGSLHEYEIIDDEEDDDNDDDDNNSCDFEDDDENEDEGEEEVLPEDSLTEFMIEGEEEDDELEEGEEDKKDEEEEKHSEEDPPDDLDTLLEEYLTM